MIVLELFFMNENEHFFYMWSIYIFVVITLIRHLVDFIVTHPSIQTSTETSTTVDGYNTERICLIFFSANSHTHTFRQLVTPIFQHWVMRASWNSIDICFQQVFIKCGPLKRRTIKYI